MDGHLGMLDDSMISDELEAHLIDLYFEWEQPWLQVVNETLFRESLACGGRYCSPLLLNCILAMGSRYCDDLEVRTDMNDSNTAGKAFVAKAEKLIQNDLRWPKITTIQSLAIMGMVYIVSAGAFVEESNELTKCDRQWDLTPLDGFIKGWQIVLL